MKTSDYPHRLEVEEALDLAEHYSNFEIFLAPGFDKFIEQEPLLLNYVANLTGQTHIVLFRPVRPGMVVPGAYVIKHVATGKLYPGYSADINRRLNNHESQLLANCHDIPALQKAFNEDPRLELYTFLTLTKDEAHLIERWIVDRLRDGGRLFNRNSIGLFGMTGLRHSKESREKMAKVQTGKKHSMETRAKIALNSSEPISIDGVVYTSQKEAAAALGIPKETVYYRLGSSNFPTWVYLSKRRAKTQKGRTTLKKPVTIDGISYKSLNAAAKATGRPFTWVKRKLTQ